MIECSRIFWYFEDVTRIIHDLRDLSVQRYFLRILEVLDFKSFDLNVLNVQ